MIRKIFRKLIYFSNLFEVNPSFHDYPFGREPLAGKDIYLEIWEKAKEKIYPVVDQYEKENNFSIDINWFHELALHTQVIIKESNICYQHGRILYTKLSKYLQKLKRKEINILESGTARGFSTICMAKALKDRGKNGKIITIDPLPHNIKMYWNCIDDNDSIKTRNELLYNYKNLMEKYITFHEGLSINVLKRLKMSRIHFSFLDGGHNYEDVNYEIGYLKRRQCVGDIIVFDDYNKIKFPGIVRAVNQLENEGNYIIDKYRISDERGYAIATKVL